MLGIATTERGGGHLRRWWNRVTGRGRSPVRPPLALFAPDRAGIGPEPAGCPVDEEVPRLVPLTGAVPPSPETSTPSPRGQRWLTRWAFGRTRRSAILRPPLLLAAAAVLWFGLGGVLLHRVDDDTAFRPPEPPAGASRVIVMAVGLIEREVLHHEWSANDPWFMPDGLLDNGPNFQRGIIAAIARFSFEMVDQLGRARGSSLADPDLERAAGFLQFPPDVWHFEPSKSWLPAVPSENQYLAGARALASYNARLAQGQAVFDRRADSFAATVARIAADLGSQSAMIDAHLARESGWIFNRHADDIYYQTKGRLYAYYLLLGELGHDFERVIVERNLVTIWNQALDSLREAASLRPIVVLDGAPEGSLFANHLAMQGFQLLRALVKLNEVVKVAAV